MTVQIVDDDDAIRDSLMWLFRSRAVDVRVWASGEAFLAGWQPAPGDCILLDMRLSGMSGREVFARLQARGIAHPVIFLTGHGDIPMAVDCLKLGAADFIEKPFQSNMLVDRVLAVLAQAAARDTDRALRERLQSARSSLSPREAEVMEAMVAGLQNKEIADRLHITIRTVEVHRARVLEKMQARNAVDLARMIGRIES
ncbi:response regulator transcription factor [Paracoccus sp. p4-l81]|uniref:response regulator transcription factor n=1 Tax=unclassified Paracoccus (in: a-proteobacteria) TaxID=2688777 RepID=UPI0035B884F2